VERRELRPPARLHRHRSHVIVYRVEAPWLAVVRILHIRQNWRQLASTGSEERVSGKQQGESQN